MFSEKLIGIPEKKVHNHLSVRKSSQLFIFPIDSQYLIKAPKTPIGEKLAYLNNPMFYQSYGSHNYYFK
jgi:hypothetical protein